MRIKTIVFFQTIIFIFLFSGCRKNDNYVILVSMDAFRWDYHELYETPNLDRIAEEGVKAYSLIPSFPTKTFPNHYTLATGLHPDHHGLINNTFYANDLGLLYRIGNREAVENGDFYGGEPIWTTVENNNMLAASMFWVGSEAAINGHQPSYWNKYDETLSYDSRLDSVIHWLSLPKKLRANFITLYFDEPDAISHSYGPVSHETDSVVVYLDNLIGELRERINQLPIRKKVNLIIVSDHGMGEVSNEKLVNLRDVIPDGLVDYYNGGNPVILLDAAEGYQDSVVNILSRTPGVKGWTALNMPEHYQYGQNARFPGIVAEADSSWSIVASKRTGYSMRSRGAHGYDPANTDMHGIFYAVGPAFKKGYESTSIHNVDIYNLVCKVLNINAAPNDGNPEIIPIILN